MQRLFNNIFLITVLIILSFLVWQGIQWIRFFSLPILAKGNIPIEIEIKPGTTAIALSMQLKNQGLITDPHRLILYTRLRGKLSNIKTGEYLIEPGKTTEAQLLENIVAGKVILRQVTIVEGWTFNQIMAAINNNPFLVHALLNLDNQAIMDKIGYSGLNLEGQFYPDTYLFDKGTLDVKVLKKSHQAMQNLLMKEWQTRGSGLPYRNPYDALIAASLIEKETAVEHERAMIAGVIVRRLQKNMPLQIDPTVIYALGDKYQGKLTTKDLAFHSPYNTYLNKGLPPTPIAVPSVASINAALHPAPGDALYYVANGNGSHIFSATLKAHDIAIEKYLLSPRMCVSGRLLLNLFRNQSFKYCAEKV
jgi:UPF0755 protein